MSMHDSRNDIRLKIEWAHKRIEEFKVAVAAFIETHPYSLEVNADPKTGKPLVHIVKASRIPPEITLIAGDVIQNLRTALDYLACGLVRWNHKAPTSHTEFPIFDHAPVTPSDEARFRRKVKGMRQEAIDAISATHPYQGGDDTLWRLHRLNRIDKHNMLITAWGNITSITGRPLFGDQWVGNRWTGVPGIPFPLKQGDKFLIDIPNVKVDKNTQFFLEIVLNESGVAEGYPLILALKQSFRRVNEIAGDFSLRFSI